MDIERILESLIAQRKACGGGKDKGDCRRPRCKRCRRGAEVTRRNAVTVTR